MDIPESPTAYIRLDNFSALEELLKNEHIEAVQNGVTKSKEHTFSLAFYAEEKKLKGIEDLKRFVPTDSNFLFQNENKSSSCKSQ